jgi:hypothetical protein
MRSSSQLEQLGGSNQLMVPGSRARAEGEDSEQACKG